MTRKAEITPCPHGEPGPHRTAEGAYCSGPVVPGGTVIWPQAATDSAARWTTWPVIECDQNDAPNFWDIVTNEVAKDMPPGTQVVVTCTDRNDLDDGYAMNFGYAFFGVVTSHKPTHDGEDVVIYVRRA